MWPKRYLYCFFVQFAKLVSHLFKNEKQIVSVTAATRYPENQRNEKVFSMKHIQYKILPLPVSVARISSTNGFEGSLFERINEMSPLALKSCV